MIGRQIGHYQVLEKIGIGGMGHVFRAHDSRLDRDVALKILLDDSAGAPESKERFKREAKAVAALKHPNIVTIYSIEVLDGIHLITMELLEGNTLSDIIPPEGFPLERFLEIAIPLVDAVSYAHGKGIIHRDLKPANIMLDREERLKVLDFGLAKLSAAQQASAEETIADQDAITKAGGLLGTLSYMSPEQISGSDVGCGSDIFSMGIVFHELLSGKLPFQGDNPAAILYSIVNSEAPRLPGIPAPLTGIVDRSLQKSAGDRFPDAGQLLQALRNLASKGELMTFTAESSAEIRAAHEREEWEESYRLLQSLKKERDLSPDELEMLGTSVSWIGGIEDCLRVSEKACALFAKEGRNIDAARVALEIVQIYISKNALAIARGWRKRAERFLQDAPDCIERGYLLRQQTVDALAEFDFEGAAELNQQCAAIAAQIGDPDLQAVALHDRGQILIAQGNVEEGTELVDEAMASVVCGEVAPSTVGNLYCRTMTICRSLADFGRVREWSEAAWRWTEENGVPGYQGVCRIHSAETLRHLGRWEEAEKAIRMACDEFEENGLASHAGEAFVELGELARRKGNFEEAEIAFRRAHELGEDPVPGFPLLRLAQGESQVALQTMERALSENPENRLRRAKLLSANIPIALANGELSIAQQSIDELADISEEFDCKVYKAHSLMGRGALEIERDNYQAASPLLLEAWTMLNGLGLSYDAARARTFLAEAYSGTNSRDDAKLQLEAACKTFEELGARPDLVIATEQLTRLA